MFAERLKQLRLEKGISQMNLAKELGIGLSSYANYERGRREPPTKLLYQIADYFDVNTDYLLGKSPHRTLEGLVGSYMDANALAERINQLYSPEGFTVILNGLLDSILPLESWKDCASLQNAIGTVLLDIAMMLRFGRLSIDWYEQDKNDALNTTRALLSDDYSMRELRGDCESLSLVIKHEFLARITDEKVREELNLYLNYVEKSPEQTKTPSSDAIEDN